MHCLDQDAVRGDHGEVVQLLVSNGAKVFKAKGGGLVELTSSRLSGCDPCFPFTACQEIHKNM